MCSGTVQPELLGKSEGLKLCFVDWMRFRTTDKAPMFSSKSVLVTFLLIVVGEAGRGAKMIA